MPPRTRTTTARKAPQDHKPKGARRQAKVVAAEATDRPFTFDAGGKTYELPHPKTYAAGVPGEVFMDAVLDGDQQAELKLSFTFLQLARPDMDDEAWTALRAKPVMEFVEIVAAWMQAGGVNLGESQRSSD